VIRSTAEVGRVVDVRARSALGRCVPDTAAFLEHEWGRRAAVFAARPGLDFSDLLTFDDVDRILTTTSLRTPAFRLVRADEAIPEGAYTRAGRTGSKAVEGMPNPARIFELFDDGATIVLQGLHRYWEPIAAFCRDLELQLGHPCQANAYVTPPGAQGLAKHEDPHDVFVLQAFGVKRWQVFTAPKEAPREPFVAEMSAGDSLYMPMGTAHSASTQASVSGHLTIGIHVATWHDVATAAWRRVQGEPLLREPIPPGWTRDPEALEREVGRILEALRLAWKALDARTVAEDQLDHFLSTRPPALRGALLDRQRASSVNDTTRVRRRDASVCEVFRRDGTLVVLLGDRRLEMPLWLEPAMRTIAAGSAFRVGDLAPVVADENSRAVLVRRLVREGLLELPSER